MLTRSIEISTVISGTCWKHGQGTAHQWDEAAGGCSGDNLNPIPSVCSGAGLGCSHLPHHMAMGQPRLPGPQLGSALAHPPLALDTPPAIPVPPNPPRDPCQDPSLHIPPCSAPPPLQVLTRLFIDSFNKGRGSSSSPAHLHKDLARRRGQEGAGALNPPSAQAGAGRRPRFINTFKGSD